MKFFHLFIYVFMASVRPELLANMQSHARSCRVLIRQSKVFFFFFFCHIFIISLTDLTKLGINVYLRGWSKAGKLVPGAKGSKKKFPLLGSPIS